MLDLHTFQAFWQILHLPSKNRSLSGRKPVLGHFRPPGGYEFGQKTPKLVPFWGLKTGPKPVLNRSRPIFAIFCQNGRNCCCFALFFQKIHEITRNGSKKHFFPENSSFLTFSLQNQVWEDNAPLFAARAFRKTSARPTL